MQHVAAVGYSTRSAAESLHVAGLRVTAIDAFCDEDTRRVAQCMEISDWPHGIIETVAVSQPDAVLLCGGMETQVDVVRQIERRCRLLGPTAEQIKQLRDPLVWAAAVDDCEGIRIPNTYSGSDRRWLAARNTRLDDVATNDERWLLKSLSGAGGLHITECSFASGVQQLSVDEDHHAAPRLLQQFVSGRVIGVVWYLGYDSVELCGAVQAWNANEWPAPLSFQYRGSFGPLLLNNLQSERLKHFGSALQQETAACGLIQADFIEDTDGNLFLLEVNPRWTAGIEILEAEHATSMCTRYTTSRSQSVSVPFMDQFSTRAAKAIYYSPFDLRLTTSMLRELQSFGRDRFRIGRAVGEALWFLSDLPPVAESNVDFSQGSPVLTIQARIDRSLSENDDRDRLLNQLRAGYEQVARLTRSDR
ncbi:MAG: ATP-grasp domain-containing protein [Pirellulales bacterium]